MHTHIPVCSCVCWRESRSIINFSYSKNKRIHTFQSYFNPLRSCKKRAYCDVYTHTNRYVQYDTHSKSDLIGGASNRETIVKLRKQKQSSCQNWRFSFAFRPLFHYSHAVYIFWFCSILSFFLSFWCGVSYEPSTKHEQKKKEEG